MGSGIARVSGSLDLYTLMSQPDTKELACIFSGAMTAFSMQTNEKLMIDVDFKRSLILVVIVEHS